MAEAPEVSKIIAGILRECLQEGMEPPFVLCSISPNGSLLGMRISDKGHTELLAEHFEPEGFRLPMTIVVLDQKNNGFRMVLDGTGKTTRH
jgi:hypothetical protein